MSTSDIATLQNCLIRLEQENERLRCLLAQQSCSQLHSCEQSHTLLQAEIAQLEQQQERQAEQRRIQELERANNALQNTVATLVERRDLDGIIGEVLHTIAHEFESPLVEYWRVLGADTVEVDTWLWDNQLYSLKQNDEHPSRGGIRFSPELVNFENFSQRGQSLTLTEPIPAYSLALDKIICPIDWYAVRGVARHFNFPLQAGSITFGAISVWLPMHRSVTEECLRLGQALSHQTALAIQLTQLAEEAKQAASAREQEQAAQARAILLERMNVMLQRSTERLSAATNPKAIVVETLRTCAEVLAPLGVKGIGLMRYQPASRTVRVMVHILDDVEQTISGSDLAGDWSVDQPTMIVPWQRIQSEDFVWGLTSDPSVLVPEVRHYHESRGACAVAYVPLRREEETVGWIGFNLASAVPPTQQQIELIRALSSQVLLAVEMEQLAEEAKQTAIAREQEQAAQERAAELAKANDALKQTVDVLATEPDLDRFLGQVLQVIAEQLDSPLTEYWYHPEPDNIAYVGLTYWQGQILKPEEQPGHVGLSGYPVPPEMIGLESLHHRRSHFVIEDMATDPASVQVAHQHGLDSAAWYRSRGVSSFLNVPLILGEKTIGALIVFVSATRQFTEQQIELAYALAQQVTLAIQLTRLAEEAKQTAIAREQEKAAQDRAAELAKANEALKRSLDALAAEPELEKFLAYVSTEIAHQTDACLAYLFLYSAENHTLELCTAFRNGQIYFEPAPGDPPLFDQPFDADITPGWRRIVAERGIYFQTVNNEDDDEIWQETKAWHAAQRHSAHAGIALVAGDQPVGFLGVAWRNKTSLTIEQTELIHALANQATLAIQLTQLAEAAKQSAIAREQEKTARARSAELAKANQVLRRSLDALVAEQTLPGFLSHVLTSVTQQLQSTSSVLWLYDQEQRAAKLAFVCNGQTVKPAAQTHHPYAHQPRDYSSPDRLPAWEKMTAQRQSTLLMVAEESCMTPPQREYLMGQGIWGILSIPLVLGDRTQGNFAIHFLAPRSFRDEELELVQTLANQAALAIELTRLSEQAKEAALLEERNRLAGEIHDTLAQAFTGISMQLSVAKWLIQQDPMAVDEILDRINDIAQTGLAEARRSVWTLYPVDQVYADLAQQLSDCVQQMTSGTAIQVDVQIDGEPCPLSPLMGKNLLRIGQEAITNTLKHAQATRLIIHLTYTEQFLRLCVQDNGHGFLTDLDRSGFGLISMSDRADRIEGQLSIDSQPGQGTAICIQVPLSSA